MFLVVVGNCVSSFDPSTGDSIGLSTIDHLQDLAIIDATLIADALACEHGQDLLNSKIDEITPYVNVEENSVLVLDQWHVTYILYNPEEDVHYFLENL